jgi:predicted CoA-binding protein
MKNKPTLVLGASLKPERYSNLAIHRLVQNNITTFAFGLRAGVVSGITIDTQLIKYTNIHTITLYLNASRQEEYYNYLLLLQPKRVIFNPGTENFELMNILEQNDISYEVACTLTLLATNQF